MISLCLSSSCLFSSLYAAFDFLLFAVSFNKCADTPLDTINTKLRTSGNCTYRLCFATVWTVHRFLDPSWHTYSGCRPISESAGSSSHPPKFWMEFRPQKRSNSLCSPGADARYQLFHPENTQILPDTIRPIQAFLKYWATQRMERVCVARLCSWGISFILESATSWNKYLWPCNHQEKFLFQQIGSEKFWIYLTSCFGFRKRKPKSFFIRRLLFPPVSPFFFAFQ